MSELPPLGERYEVRKETRFCVYRVGDAEPIAVTVSMENAKVCRAMLERDEWPWYARPKNTETVVAVKAGE